jgi:hypothetical protein
MRADRARANRNQSAAQREITAELLARATELGAESFALTGSTARRRRTAMSDLDYHIIGPRPDLSDLPAEIDVVASSAVRFRTQLAHGDDYCQWTLRHGCILHDVGAMREGTRLILDEHLWPSAHRKLEHVDEHRQEAKRLLLMGDRDAAQEQVRATLTTIARGLLLDAGVFPLARSELPDQLRATGYESLSEALTDVIYDEPALDELSAAVSLLDSIDSLRRDRSAA